MSRAAELARELGIECRQALFSDWGNFYAPIKAYPCALFDANGFVVVASSEDAVALGVRLGKRTNVPHRIASLSRYQLVSAWRNQPPEELPPIDASAEYFEGATTSVRVNRYERDRGARNACLAHYGYRCQACGVALGEIYGGIAEGFIHVHHLKPLGSIGTQYQLDPVRDLRPLCPNCHAVAHLRPEPFSVEELQAMIQARKAES